MHFKDLEFAQMTTNVRSSFPVHLSDTIDKQNVQIIASNILGVEAHGLEYRTWGRLTQTFTVCIEVPIDKVKWCTADNKSVWSHLLVTKHCQRTQG